MVDDPLVDRRRRLTPVRFRDEIADIAAQLRAKIDAAVDAFPVDAKARAERRAKVFDPVTGFEFFARTYFPHYLTKPASKVHEHLFARLPAISAAGGGARDVIIAPRGAAKSTLASLIYPIWRVIVGRSRYIIIAMDSYPQAALQIEAIKAEFEVNPRLAMDFPGECGQGRVWREGEIVTRTQARIEGVGSGMKLRGRRHGPHRPDLVILDEIENDENVQSPEQRDKTLRWIDRAVLKLGPADGSLDCVIVGTVLHYDAVILRIAARSTWRVARFAAILAWPDRMDLWDLWQEALENDGDAAAAAFYRDHRAEMDAGAVLNWPAMQSLSGLMRERAESLSAFATEQMGEPIAENAPFQRFTFWSFVRRDWVLFGAVDPSLGKASKGRDPSAILVGGFDRSGSAPVLDIVEASIRRRLPDVIIADVIAMQKTHQCSLWFVETVQFQEFFRTELMKRAAVDGVALPAMPIQNTTDKTLRIERLQPPIAAGLIRFSSAHATLLQQLRQWPAADHDDGPDCLEMLWTHGLAYSGTAAGDGVLTAPRVDRGWKKGYRL